LPIDSICSSLCLEGCPQSPASAIVSAVSYWAYFTHARVLETKMLALWIK